MCIRAVAILPNNIYYDRLIGTEEFNIMLQSSFVYIARANISNLKFERDLAEFRYKAGRDKAQVLKAE